MLYSLDEQDMFLIDGGLNGWYVVGGILVTAGGVLECASGGGAITGVPTAMGGVGMIIYGATH